MAHPHSYGIVHGGLHHCRTRIKKDAGINVCGHTPHDVKHLRFPGSCDNFDTVRFMEQTNGFFSKL